MSEKPPSIETLEKQLRMLRKKLDRSEQHRADLEDQRDRDQLLYKKLHAEVEAARREAEIEAALERVRAEIASMRTADDLRRITPLIWRELTTLGVPFFRCGVFIIDEAAETTHTYLSTPDGTSLAALHLPFDSTPLVEETVDHWRSRQVYTDQWDQEQFAAWVTTMVEQGTLQTPLTPQPANG